MPDSPNTAAPDDRLQRLAAFLPVLEDPGFVAATSRDGWSPDRRVLTLPLWDHHPLVGRFVDVAYADGWVLADLDWARWMRSDEAERLRDVPGAIEGASLEQISRLITVLVRQERFAEGSLAAAFEGGLVLRIVRRVAELARLDRPPT